jgi:branched-chain amino acid transport system ATP-binding protein
MSSTSLLAAEGISAGYGSIPVLRDVSVSVEPGEVVVLLGANGAGKSTTVKVLAGVLPTMSGSVVWKGSRSSDPLHVRVRSGLGYVPEERSIISKLTVGENLRFGIGDTDRSLTIFPELRNLWGRKAGLISGGEQRMLSLGRALCSRPAALIADEMSLGLAPIIVRRLLAVVREAADAGAGVLLVEQHAQQALAVADRAYVLRRGSVVWTGSASEARSKVGDIEGLYLGL